MKVQIKEVAPGKWAIYLLSSIGVNVGRTTYDSSNEAEKVARAQHPDKEIEVIRQTATSTQGSDSSGASS